MYSRLFLFCFLSAWGAQAAEDSSSSSQEDSSSSSQEDPSSLNPGALVVGGLAGVAVPGIAVGAVAGGVAGAKTLPLMALESSHKAYNAGVSKAQDVFLKGAENFAIRMAQKAEDKMDDGIYKTADVLESHQNYLGRPVTKDEKQIQKEHKELVADHYKEADFLETLETYQRETLEKTYLDPEYYNSLPPENKKETLLQWGKINGGEMLGGHFARTMAGAENAYLLDALSAEYDAISTKAYQRANKGELDLPMEELRYGQGVDSPLRKAKENIKFVKERLKEEEKALEEIEKEIQAKKKERQLKRIFREEDAEVQRDLEKLQVKEKYKKEFIRKLQSFSSADLEDHYEKVANSLKSKEEKEIKKIHDKPFSLEERKPIPLGLEDKIQMLEEYNAFFKEDPKEKQTIKENEALIKELREKEDLKNVWGKKVASLEPLELENQREKAQKKIDSLKERLESGPLDPKSKKELPAENHYKKEFKSKSPEYIEGYLAKNPRAEKGQVVGNKMIEIHRRISKKETFVNELNAAAGAHEKLMDRFERVRK